MGDRKSRSRNLKRGTESEGKALTAFEVMAVRSPEAVETVGSTNSAPPVQQAKVSTTTTESTWSGVGVQQMKVATPTTTDSVVITGSVPGTTGVPAGNGSVIEVIPNAGPAVKQASQLAPVGQGTSAPIPAQGTFAVGGAAQVKPPSSSPPVSSSRGLEPQGKLASLPSSAAPRPPGAVQSQSRPPFGPSQGSQPPNASNGPFTTVSHGLQPPGVFSSVVPTSQSQRGLSAGSPQKLRPQSMSGNDAAARDLQFAPTSQPPNAPPLKSPQQVRPQGVANPASQFQSVGFGSPPQSVLPTNSAARDLRPNMQISTAPVPQPQSTQNIQFESMAAPRDLQPRDLQQRDLQTRGFGPPTTFASVGGQNFQSQSGYSQRQLSSGGNMRDDSITSDLFDMIDRDHDGRISLSEFRAAMDRGFFTSGDSFPAVFE